MVVTTENLLPFTSAPPAAASHPELDLLARDRNRSTIPSLCAVVVLLAVELAWFGLLLFLARKLILA
jgi:hypothetical protein